MKRNVLLSLFSVLLCSMVVLANTAPTVTNVSASQRTDGSGIVDIAYTLNDADSDRCTVSVVVSNDGGSTWTITPSSWALSGALTNVSNGRRQITWASKTDLPGMFGSNYRIKVTADDGQAPVGMVSIPAGTFQMGNSFSNEGGLDELPRHWVTLSPFYMGKYEVTNQQYCDFLNSALAQGLITNPANTSNVVYKAGSGTSFPYCNTHVSSLVSQIDFSGGVFSVRPKSGRSMANDPIGCVSWYGAVAYCNWRSQQEGRQTCYNDFVNWTYDFSKNGYHLPTEAQWEYAARGGVAGKRYPWGDTINQTQANFRSTSYHPLWNDGINPYTSPVGFFDGGLKYKANYNWSSSLTSYQTANGGNGYGLYDMAGNVREWCNDWYGSYSSASQTNPTGPTTGSDRITRGEGWGGVAQECRVASRVNHVSPTYRLNGDIGFRIVLDLN